MLYSPPHVLETLVAVQVHCLHQMMRTFTTNYTARPHLVPDACVLTHRDIVRFNRTMCICVDFVYMNARIRRLRKVLDVILDVNSERPSMYGE